MTKNKSRKNVQVQKKPSTARAQSAGANNSSLAKRLDQLMQRIPKGSFAAAGGALGGPMGAMAGKAISNITGYGDYAVGANTVSRKGVHGGVEVPSFSNKSVRITHREFFGNVTVPHRPDVEVASTFHCDAYSLDPTDPALAPWVSTIAKRFGKYKIHGLVIYYKPTSPDYGNSGTLAIAVNTDPAERPFESLSGILNSKFAVSAKPSVALVAPVECDPSTLVAGGTMLVNHPNIYKDGAVIDSRFTSMGTLNVATEGLTLHPGTILGQLHMTIDLELISPFYHIGLETSLATRYATYERAGKTSDWFLTHGITPPGIVIERYGSSGPNPEGWSTVIKFAKPGLYQVSGQSRGGAATAAGTGVEREYGTSVSLNDLSGYLVVADGSAPLTPVSSVTWNGLLTVTAPNSQFVWRYTAVDDNIPEWITVLGVRDGDTTVN